MCFSRCKWGGQELDNVVQYTTFNYDLSQSEIEFMYFCQCHDNQTLDL